MVSPALQSLTDPTPEHIVLLIEEYEALAAAIISALKKFAPHHATRLARSITEAETVAKTVDPRLFVIDFDPPYSNLTAFLQKMRTTHPDVRVLIIAPGIPSEIAAERRSYGALQFIEKPFDVADFGAAVQALLGPWKEAESAHPRGTLRSLSLADIVLLQCAGGRSLLIEVKESNGKSGEIHLLEGQFCHAETGKCSGAEALEEMFTWREVQMREVEKPSAARYTIQGSWAAVFLEAYRQAKARQPVPAAPPEKAAPPKPPPKTEKKIVAIDDTEMLLIFVEDVLATADPQMQITTALSGTSGIKEIERVKPDLVLLDYSLPDINGDEVCRRLLQNELTASIPVLMMSGHVAEMRAAAAEFGNVVATIEKPFLSDALIGLVQQTLSAKPRPARKTVEAVKAAEPQPLPATPPVERPEQPRNGEAVELKPAGAPAPSITPEQAEIPKVTIISVPVVSKGLSEVVLGLFLEVVSMQLTTSFRVGVIRAKLSSSRVSLHFVSAALPAALPQTGFQLGAVEVDQNNRIATVRVIPTLQPFKPLVTRHDFQIGAVAVVPADSQERVRLTPKADAPMTMQLMARLELAGVELSQIFQVEHFILKSRSNTAQVTFNSQAIGQKETEATCEITAVQLDDSGYIEELLLNPIK